MRFGTYMGNCGSSQVLQSLLVGLLSRDYGHAIQIEGKVFLLVTRGGRNRGDVGSKNPHYNSFLDRSPRLRILVTIDCFYCRLC